MVIAHVGVLHLIENITGPLRNEKSGFQKLKMSLPNCDKTQEKPPPRALFVLAFNSINLLSIKTE
ncbi:MAG: hypothetical protein QOK64_08480 [Nitrososphaeraceae archaeon]|nr:hypothetical protein [Nitrososphaeraceae archaeon]